MEFHFASKGENNIYSPNTVLATDMRDETIRISRVVLTLRKKFTEEKYDELVYQAKGVKSLGLIVPNEVLCKMSDRVIDDFC